MKPVVKWAGGKTQLLEELTPIIPEFNTYYEPFFGGGALYFSLQPVSAVINDSNEQLMNLYSVIRDEPNKLMRNLNKLQKEHSEEYYYYIRNKYNKSLKKNRLTKASASYLVYLNKSGFNGLYRLNSGGLFNVPSGHRKKVSLYERDNVLEVSQQLQNTTILSVDFEEACRNAIEGDFVYFDSPYYNTFDTYQPGGFSEEDHRRLANLFRELTNRGVNCLLTNSNEQFIRELYNGFNIRTVDVKRMINSDGNNRTGEEVIITNY